MRGQGVAGGLIALLVLTAACGSTGNVPVGQASAVRQVTPSSPTSRAGSLIVLTTTDSSSSTTLRLVDVSGNVVASTQFVAPPRPNYSNCAPILQSPVRIAAGAAFYADRTGLVRRLDVDGSVHNVATFKLSNPQQALSYAVSPDGRQLIAIVLDTPPLHNPPPRTLGDQVFDPGYWTLDLETAVAGGPTKLVLHKNLGASAPSPTVITGWDAFGPTATLNSWICTQNVLPSLRYTSGTLIHLGMDGTHQDRIGGTSCPAWDELNDGMVLCGGTDWSSFTVRRRNGDVIWAGGGDQLLFVSLSPDGNAVASSDGAVYLRDPFDTTSHPGPPEPNATILGWAGPSTVVVQRDDGHVGVAPVTDPTVFSDLGIAMTKSCSTCGFYEAMVIGTI